MLHQTRVLTYVKYRPIPILKAGLQLIQTKKKLCLSTVNRMAASIWKRQSLLKVIISGKVPCLYCILYLVTNLFPAVSFNAKPTITYRAKLSFCLISLSMLPTKSKSKHYKLAQCIKQALSVIM